jgi:hypothetical protein
MTEIPLPVGRPKPFLTALATTGGGHDAANIRDVDAQTREGAEEAL